MHGEPQPTLMPPPHQNHGLFSDNYLNQVLPARAAWESLIDDARPVLAGIMRIFAAFAGDGANERQTEDDLICPILRLLGHEFEVQAALKTPLGTKSPDYIFFKDPESRLARRGDILTDALLAQGALAVGDAKKWNRPLDIAMREATDPFSNQIPAVQISFYLQHSGLSWGLLTNGRQWRLVHHDSAHKLDVYYQVDLVDAIESGDIERFLYFYAFFRRAAFDPGPIGLAEILRESTDYAHAIGSSLKEQVFDALRHLAQGFLDYTPNGFQHDEASLTAIYDNSLIILYRLIFILYAEARDLLPMRASSNYRDSFSFHSVKTTVADNLAHGRYLLSGSSLIWPRLSELFQIIDAGSPPLKVATFNGGLFDPVRHEFLERYRVGDAHLQQAIDMLSRVKGEFVDYRDLSVQHMGTIYEGLLEFRLHPISGIDDGDDIHGRDGHVTAGWSIELMNDKGERKASGSYYTPENIVKFIVEHTVGPALWQAVEGKRTDPDIVCAVLGVNVLDPAMGSGHFLVEATEFIARFLADFGIVPEGKTAEEADLAYWKRRVVQSCIYGVDLNPLAVELAKLSLWLITVAKDRPLSFLDHHLRAGNSLAGAWLEHLAIGNPQAKKTATPRQTRAAQAEANGQVSLFGDSAFTQQVYKAVNNMWLIEQADANTVQDVKEQERVYAELRRQFVAKYIRLLNLATASYFGVEVDKNLWRSLVEYATAGNVAQIAPFERLLEQADDEAARTRFFHWELEFPEIFFDRFGRPHGEDAGFSVVIGNPPYVRAEQLLPFKSLFQTRFASFHGTADLYLYFYEQGLRLTRRGAKLGYISSGTFARANFAVAFRQWLPTVATLETVVDFGENQPFPGAEMVRPSIIVLHKGKECAGFRSLFLAEKIPASLEQAFASDGVECEPAVLAQPEWVFQCGEQMHLMHKIMQTGRNLNDVVGGKAYRGITTGFNDAFIIDQATHDHLLQEDPSCAALLKPVLQGEDLRPWYQEDEGRWLIFTRRGTDINEYPSVKAHLQKFRNCLEPKTADWEDGLHGEWQGRKIGTYQWYEIQDSIEYYDAFEKPKIVWSDISKLPRFSHCDPGVYIGNTGYVIPDAPFHLLGILQSRVLWFAISQICQPLRLRAGLWQYRVLPQFVTRLPIPALADNDKEAIGALSQQMTTLARARYALHQRVRHRLLADLGAPECKMNQKLTAWWEQDFTALRAEVKKVFKRDITLIERDEWEMWHDANRAEHERLTGEIIQLETELNARVYVAFDLTTDEVRLVEESTKYRYGEV